MARKKLNRDALEKYETILGYSYDYLVSSVSGHKMEHTTRVLDIYSVCQPLDEFAGEISDVFPSSPEWFFPFPRDERASGAYQTKENNLGRKVKRRQDDPDYPDRSENASKKKTKAS
jgi:hypothetical protein